MHHATLILLVLATLLIEACAMERPDWRSDRGSIGGAVRDPLTHVVVD